MIRLSSLNLKNSSDAVPFLHLTGPENSQEWRNFEKLCRSIQIILLHLYRKEVVPLAAIKKLDDAITPYEDKILHDYINGYVREQVRDLFNTRTAAMKMIVHTLFKAIFSDFTPQLEMDFMLKHLIDEQNEKWKNQPLSNISFSNKKIWILQQVCFKLLADNVCEEQTLYVLLRQLTKRKSFHFLMIYPLRSSVKSQSPLKWNNSTNPLFTLASRRFCTGLGIQNGPSGHLRLLTTPQIIFL